MERCFTQVVAIPHHLALAKEASDCVVKASLDGSVKVWFEASASLDLHCDKIGKTGIAFVGQGLNARTKGS